MMMTKKMMKSCIFIMILCLLLASCAPDRETDDDKEVYGEELSDQSDDSGKDIVVEEEEDPIENDMAEGDNAPVEEAPVPLPEVVESVPEHITYISHDFLELLSGCIQERNESILSAIIVDRELTNQDLEAYADDPVVAEHIHYLDEVGGLFLKVDGDNDGIEDLFAWFDDGGSLGNSTRHFLKGQADGSFQCTTVTEGVTQELFFAGYDDTVYLIETGYDYNRKVVNGFVVSLYREGEILETLTIAERAETYEPTVIYQAAGYEELAEKYAEEGRNGFWVDNNDEFSYEIGSAETIEDEEEARDILALNNSTDMYLRIYPIYCSDFDNNGEQEWYMKYIFYPGNLSTYLSLDGTIYQIGGGKESIYDRLRSYALEYEGLPLYFWVDTLGDKQIVLLLSYEGLYREYLYGYLIEEDQVEKVMEIDYIGNPVIRYQNINVLHGVSIAPEDQERYDECPVMSGLVWIW